MDKVLYNRLNEDNTRPVDFEVNEASRIVRFFFAENEQLIVLGEVNKKYAFWISRTELKDVKENNYLFEKVSTMPIQRICSIDEATKFVSNGDEMKFLFSEKLYPNPNGISFWMTPFDKMYDHDGCFGVDTLNYYNLMKEKANQVDKVTKSRINEYLIRTFNRSSDAQEDYGKYYPIIKITQETKYLLLSEDELTKLTYIELKKNCLEIIQRYQATLNK